VEEEEKGKGERRTKEGDAEGDDERRLWEIRAIDSMTRESGGLCGRL